MNKINLQKMENYIKTIPQELFNMCFCRKDYNNSKTEKCKSIGCLIGHCTILDAENVTKNFIDKNGQINFISWSIEFTGLEGVYWDWCFSQFWKKTDNTPTGAAKRIEYLINNGLPENWRYMMYGKEKLCY